MEAKSAKGQVPFIELNGVQIADSYFIIEQLTKTFHKEEMESKLSALEQSISRAFCALAEDSLFWANYMVLVEHYKELFDDKIMGKHFTATQKFFKPFYDYRFLEHMKTRVYQQGIGRHSLEEAESKGNKDLDALNTYLGNKKFFFGNNPTYVDALVFGHICQIWCMPYEHSMKTHMKEHCPKLVGFFEHIKATFYSDWDELCAEGQVASPEAATPTAEAQPAT